MKLTLRMLADANACDPQVEHAMKVFDTLSTGGVEITRENLIIARENGLDIEWLYLNVIACNYSNDEMSARLTAIGIPETVAYCDGSCTCNSCRLRDNPDTVINLILHECALIDDKPVMPVSEDTPSGL